MVPFTVEFLGTGTSQGIPIIQCKCEVCQSKDPRDKRLRCSIAISTGLKTLIVDIGPDFRQQLLRSSYPTIDQVLLTHEHNDHVAGMDDLRPYNFKQKTDIPVYLMERVGEDLKSRYAYAFGPKKYPGTPGYELHYIQHGDTWEWEGISITAFEVMHGNLPILGFRFNDFVYITDAKSIPEHSMKYLKNIDKLVLNALQEEHHWSHFTMSEAREMSFGLEPKETYFTHLSHTMGRHEKIQDKLASNQFFAFDGLTLKLG